jgi:hypothetical protein
MRSLTWLWLVMAVAALPLGCSGGGGEKTGHACTSVTQCYPGIDQSTLQGTAVCLDRVTNGYCTHNCVDDTDCCAVAGECETGFPQVCAPFESTGEYYCFLSCEGVADAATYCQDHASPAFGCRSTGGGSTNRQVCVP